MKLRVGMYGHWKVLKVECITDEYGKHKKVTRPYSFLGSLEEIIKDRDGTHIKFCCGPRLYPVGDVIGFFGVTIHDIKPEV